MIKKSDEAKQAIIRATTDLIMQSNGNMDEITTRMIAEKAGVGVGLINYHFQTKDNLVEVCVQKIIDDVTDNFRPQLNSNLNTNERLKSVVKMVADFLMGNQALSRISILADQARPAVNDNTMKTIKGLTAVIVNSDGVLRKSDKFSAFALTSVLQSAFLRKDMTTEICGYDFNMKEQRDSFIDLMVDKLFGSGDTNE
ncbi:TetR/AcrR family transcriptional regulator [Paenibacillus anaericanus]|uniref:TetR/AcrR family transcriptional regulator n=1 Tax=Paenibacillus anaericanus TaxID=170367 RepID=A0A3S1DVG8_9BACL|nr:TetR/AcrR family transcriptional regulator [Paenibacillus anaericanus]RUT48234.1 TetR/AcrR family transcriptional regulator [Paenibacillus anaericanus]